MIVSFQLGGQRNYVFKGTPKNWDLTENKVNVASDPNVQNFFFNII